MSMPAGDPARFSRAEEIFFEVAGLSPADQAAAIARLAGDDEPLRLQVRSLLDSAARVGGFMEQPVLGKLFDELTSDSRAAAEDDELLGTTLGSFRLEKRLASGGMGTVYLAARSDAQFDQRVAIKVVKRGMDTDEIVRRFREERQTLAQLDHPYIARLLDGGVTPDGRPYLVMEYVDGLPIDRYCDSRRLSTAERLKLFRRVCEGVHAAHQSLIIHRDLKPSNILVTAAGVPKLLDFGIAKVLSGTRDVTHTAETERRLTPEYASPEQIIGGPITTASDVYSLGVIIYELLCGVRPYSFAVRTTDEVRRLVCFQPPQAPSEAVPTRAARLRTSTGPRPGSSQPGAPAAAPTTGPGTDAPAAATVDHPRTRGVSATRLRGQLRGDLDNIVLMALRKEPQRRYASAEQFGADIGRYLGGMPVQARRDTWLYRSGKFVRRNAPAVIAGGLAVLALAGGLVLRTQQKAEIERQRDQVVAANHRLDETRQFLVSILSGAQASGRGPSATLSEVLQDAARTIETSPPADPLTLASVKEAVGTALMTLGMADKARPLLESALAEFSSQPPESDLRIAIETELAQLLYYEGKAAEAEAPLRQLLDRERTLRAGAPSARQGDLLNALGAVLRVTRRFDEALTVQQQALTVRTAVHGAASLPVAETLNNIATIHFSAGRFAEAVPPYEQAMAIRTARLRPGHPMILGINLNLGATLSRMGQSDRALPMLHEAVDNWQAAFGSEHPGVVIARTALGQGLRKAGKPQEAVEVLTPALQWQEQHKEVSAAARLATRANIALALADFADCPRALAAITEIRGDAAAQQLPRQLAVQLLESLITLCERCGLPDDKAKARDALKQLQDAARQAEVAKPPPASPTASPATTPK